MTIARIRSVWTGFTGAPGYTNFHIDVPGVSPTAVTTFWSGVRPWLPNAVTVTPDNGGDLIDEVTGQIQNTWTGTGGSPITGMGGNSGPLPAGAVITWHTDDVAAGRRVRGRTFIVPLAAMAYEANGTLSATCMSEIKSAADALIANSGQEFGVWRRPRPGVAGSFHVVTRAEIKDKAAVLTSRRD